MSDLGKNSQRIKNILSGKYTDKSKLQTGYKKKQISHKEGEIWEDQEKFWTIKDGIKQNVTKMDAIRKLTTVPLTCPQCGNVMKNKNDKKMWRLRKKCLGCVVTEDTERMINGTFSEYEHEIISKNVTGWITDIEEQVHDYIESMNVDNYVTEYGQIEDWSNNTTKEKLKEAFSKQIEEFKKKSNNYIKKEKQDEKK